MGWGMLFWVSVIVGVPTVLWFLLPEEGPGNGGRDREDYNTTSNILRRQKKGGLD